MSEEEGLFRVTGKRQPEESGFKVTARRDGGSGRISVKNIRKPTPDELPRLRELKLGDVQTVIYQATSRLANGRRISVDLQPHIQQYDNSCLLASAISVSEGIARSQRTPQNFDEATLSTEARRLGILARGGMTTETTIGRQAVEEFLENRLGIDLHHVDEREPIEMGKACVEAILKGDVVLLNSGAHWVAVYGLDKSSSQEINWNVIDPLRREPQTYTTPQLSEKLVGSILLKDGAGVSGEIFTVSVPKPAFRPTQVRPGQL